MSCLAWLSRLPARGENGKNEANRMRVVAANEGSEKLRHVLESVAEAVVSLETVRQTLLVQSVSIPPPTLSWRPDNGWLVLCYVVLCCAVLERAGRCCAGAI